MNAVDRLDALFGHYETLKRTNRLARRALRGAVADKSIQTLLVRSGFSNAGESSAVAEHGTAVESTGDLLDELIILAMWSVAERAVFDYVLAVEATLSGAATDTLQRDLLEKAFRDLEYSRFDDLLDVFKARISADVIGLAKQVKHYRDYLAHRNPKRKSVPPVTPKHALSCLKALLTAVAGLTTP